MSTVSVLVQLPQVCSQAYYPKSAMLKWKVFLALTLEIYTKTNFMTQTQNILYVVTNDSLNLNETK